MIGYRQQRDDLTQDRSRDRSRDGRQMDGIE